MEPKIYVACLASYNAGKLHGEWIDAAQDAEDLGKAIQAMLKASPAPGAEEWAIHDYEDFGGLAKTLGENPDLEEVAECAAAIEEHGEAALFYIEDQGEWNAERFDEAYCGTYKDEEDYAYESAHSIEEISDHWDGYIDWKKYAQDLFMCDYTSREGSEGTHVYRNM
jgi:antirestriction protein